VVLPVAQASLTHWIVFGDAYPLDVALKTVRDRIIRDYGRQRRRR